MAHGGLGSRTSSAAFLTRPAAPVFTTPRADLSKVASRQPSTGTVVPELKFLFWQKMFTHRYDVRLWDVHLKRVFPQHNPAKSCRENALYESDFGCFRCPQNCPTKTRDRLTGPRIAVRPSF